MISCPSSSSIVYYLDFQPLGVGINHNLKSFLCSQTQGWSGHSQIYKRGQVVVHVMLAVIYCMISLRLQYDHQSGVTIQSFYPDFSFLWCPCNCSITLLHPACGTTVQLPPHNTPTSNSQFIVSLLVWFWSGSLECCYIPEVTMHVP